MGGGAWPFLDGGMVCLVSSGDERANSQLNDVKYDPHLITPQRDFVRLTQGSWRQNQFCDALDVLGFVRATLMHSTSFRPCRKKLGNLQCAS